MNIALIVFAGSGKRIQTSIPKQFVKINDMELVLYTIKKFEDNPHIDDIVLVTSKDFYQYTESLVDEYQLSKVKKIVVGGDTRQDSVRLGLSAVEYNEDDNILIHDGDRPLVSNAIINQCVEHLNEYNASCPVLETIENYPEISASGRKAIVEGKAVDIQTPQAFKFGLIKTAHLNKMKEMVSDDISLIEEEVEIKYFPGEKDNFKVTKNEDLKFLESLIGQES